MLFLNLRHLFFFPEPLPFCLLVIPCFLCCSFFILFWSSLSFTPMPEKKTKKLNSGLCCTIYVADLRHFSQVLLIPLKDVTQVLLISSSHNSASTVMAVGTCYNHIRVYWLILKLSVRYVHPMRSSFFWALLIDATINPLSLALPSPLNCWWTRLPPLGGQARSVPVTVPSGLTLTDRDL